MIKYKTEPGQSICGASNRAARLAQMKNEEVEFRFNDAYLSVTPTSNPDDIVLIYALKCELARLGSNVATNHQPAGHAETQVMSVGESFHLNFY